MLTSSNWSQLPSLQYNFLSAGYFLLSLTKKIVKREKHDAKRINALNLIYGGFKELKVLNKINYFILKYIKSNKLYSGLQTTNSSEPTAKTF